MPTVVDQHAICLTPPTQLHPFPIFPIQTKMQNKTKNKQQQQNKKNGQLPDLMQR